MNIDPAIKNPKCWGYRAAKRPRNEGFHINECELIERDVPDWWNAEDVQNPPMKHIREWYDPNGTRVDDFDWDGMAVYTDFDLSIAFADPLGLRFIAPPPEPIYSEGYDKEEKVDMEQTDADIKAAHNKVEAVEITKVEINKKSRIYKHAQEFIELLSKNGGITSVKLGDKTIKHETDADVDPSNDFFMVPGIGSIIFALAKAILFFTAPTTVAPTKLSLLKSRIDDYQGKLRSLQIQHKINPTEDVQELECRAMSVKLLSDKISELKTEIDGRMNNAPSSPKRQHASWKLFVISARLIPRLFRKKSNIRMRFSTFASIRCQRRRRTR